MPRVGGEQRDAGAPRERLEGRPERAVVRHAAGKAHAPVSARTDSTGGLGGQGVDHRPLVARAQVGHARLDVLGGHLLEPVAEARLETREAEIELTPPLQAARESEGVVAPSGGALFDKRASGIAEPEELGSLVERLAGRVVAGRRQDRERAVRTKDKQKRVPAGGDEAEMRQERGKPLRELGRRLGVEREEGRPRMGPQVVDAGERHAPRQGDRLGGGDADGQARGEARAVRDCDLRHRRAAGSPAGRREQRREVPKVLAGRQARDHPAMALVQRNLARHPLAGQTPRRVEEGHRGFVARAFEGEDHG